MQDICRITRFSSITIPSYIHVIRIWRAYFKLAKTLLLRQDEVTAFIVLHNKNDKKRKRKVLEDGKIEKWDQVNQPDWDHMEAFHDFLRIWVELVNRLECHGALLFEQYITAKCIEAVDPNRFVRGNFVDVKTIILYLQKNYDIKNTNTKGSRIIQVG